MEKIDDIITLHKANNVTNAGSWQSRIDGVKAVMIAKLGLVAGDFVEVPVLFTPIAVGATHRASAYVPNMVNLLVANGHLVVPDPFFDPFKADFDDKLAALGYKKSSDAAASIHFIDNFIWYHALQGQVHCGTNSRREIVAAPGWWTQR